MFAINGREYEWADITVIFGGRDLTGIRSVKIKQKRETEEIYGKGRNPVSIQSGNNSYEGEIEILQSDYLALETAAGGNILNAVVDILVVYGNPLNGDVMKTKKIVGVKIHEAELAAKQGDKFMPITLPFKALGIKDM